MRRIHAFGATAALVTFALGLGCWLDDESDPNAAELGLLREGSAAAGALADAMDASSEAVVADGSGGLQKSADGRKDPVTFAFQGSVLAVVTLPNTDHPNATGEVTVTATGSVVGDQTDGSVSYSVAFEVTSPAGLTFTDPSTGATATVPQHTSLSYDLDVMWLNDSGANQWVRADAVATLPSVQVALSNGVTTVTATVSGQRTGHVGYGVESGAAFIELSGASEWDATWTRNAVAHAVHVDATVDIAGLPLSTVYVTIDGVTYGPYTILGILARWGIVVK